MSNQIHPGAEGAAAFPGAAQLAALQQTHNVNNGAVSVTVLPDNVAAWANYKQVRNSRCMHRPSSSSSSSRVAT